MATTKRRALYLLSALPLLLTAVGCGGDDKTIVVVPDAGPDPTPPPAQIDDDFCHGQDDGTLCDDNNPCTTGDICGAGVCLGRPVSGAMACDDGDACTTDDTCVAGSCAGTAVDCSDLDTACEVGVCGADGSCAAAPREDGTSCDDGDACTNDDVCTAGVCGGEALICDDGDPCTDDACEEGRCIATNACADLNGPCTVGACDPRDGSCTAFPLTNGIECDDSDPCTVDTRCTDGTCDGGGFSATGTECDDSDACTQGDACNQGDCAGTATDCSDLNDACLVGECDPESGECAAVPVPDETACDDGDPCTEGTVCSSGACGGGELVCFCSDKEDGTECDDENPCTEGDTCQSGDCAPGPLKDCTDFDAACATGVCDPGSGDCLARIVPNGSACDDGSACTTDDTCSADECVGQAVDCGALDGDCQVGRCNPDDGACEVVFVPDGTECDDVDECTGRDACTEGTCAGSVSLCDACTGLASGEPCDDGDPCTQDDACDGTVCRGSATDCSAEDTTCAVGICNAADGSCGTVPRVDGAVCDDGDSCTVGDVCGAGACAGTAIDLCGAEVDGCESATAPPGGTVQDATELALIEGGIRYFARLNGSGDQDWYALELAAGQIITARTQARCDVELDTTLSLWPQGGIDPIIENDDFGGTRFSEISDFEVSAPGTWFLRVGGFSEAQGAYVLEIEVRDRTPCSEDADCGCGDLVCVVADGEDIGRCVAGPGPELEPNGDPTSATELTTGEARLGAVDGRNDFDWYVVSLEEGRNASIETRYFCAEDTQTSFTLFDVDGRTQLRESENVGEDGVSARLEGFIPSSAGDYYVLVQSTGVFGRYVLSVDDSPCAVDADCGCGDQVCVTEGEDAGRCVPRTSLSETGSTAVPMMTDIRYHAMLDDVSDLDVFTVNLQPGEHRFETASYCGGSIDTVMTLMSPAGAVLATNDDSGEPGGFSRITYDVPEAGAYTVRVAGFRPEIGPYIIWVESPAPPTPTPEPTPTPTPTPDPTPTPTPDPTPTPTADPTPTPTPTSP